MCSSDLVRMNLRGDFLLDALMVNQGAAPSNFAFGYGAEIALAQNWRRLNTLFLDECTNQQVRYDIRGTWPPGATLAFSVHNAYGDTRALPSIPLPAGTDVVAGALPVVPASVTRPLGAQRLAARLVSPGGASLGPAQGSNAGGYAVTVSGRGFGTSPGTVTIGGFPLVQTAWSDTSITVNMPDMGSSLGAWNIVVTTAEGAATNAAPFTFLARP